ncbi:MAG TPA: hypothetical protein VM452_03125 [Caulifigura sp.]|jgi:hypothetical protein|nr:hypothetical protein [Caulifigura sp.]
MRRIQLVLAFTMFAMAAAGCGRGSAPDRAATKVLRADEVKVTIGNPKPAAPAADAKP